jgi:hypothetical protein
MNKSKIKQTWNDQENLFRQIFSQITDKDIRLTPGRKKEMLYNIFSKLNSSI